MLLKKILITLLLLFLSACARVPLKGPDNAMRITSAPKPPSELKDDLPIPPLLKAIEDQIQFIEKSQSFSDFNFGGDHFTKSEYLSGLRRFVEIGRSASNTTELYEKATEEFDFREVYGKENWGEVFMTSYFEPLIPGSKKRTPIYSQPLYTTPPDLLTIRLHDFDPNKYENKSLRGRVLENRVVPYYSRKEIDSDQKLARKKLEICWVDPIDAFYLQIQGSGTVEFQSREKIHVNYADKNGHPYEPVGRQFKKIIPPEQLNLHTIEAQLRKLPQDELQKILNSNPSYVFFRKLDQSALTSMGVPATDGRTIATDAKYFPKGALAFLIFDKPEFDQPEDLQAARFTPTSRFVLDQDIGGAIQGGGRLDLFWGRGSEAKHYAGVIKHSGKLYYLTPKRK